MISILYQNSVLPNNLLVGQTYALEVQVNGALPSNTRWVISAMSGAISSGFSPEIIFTPLTAQVYFINVAAVDFSGNLQQQTFTVTVSNRRNGAATVFASWKTLTAVSGDTLSARVVFLDPEGLPPASISWILYQNFVQVASGISLCIDYFNAPAGLYTVVVQAADATGAQVVGESSMRVQGIFEIQSSLQPAPVSPTMQYLGSVFTFQCNGGGGILMALPYVIGTISQELFLLPGTTHFVTALDSAFGVDDVVARTFTGNWATVGPPSGLSGQLLHYDYTLGQPYVPAPADLRTKITADAYKVSGTFFGPYSFRVEIKCYRQGPPLYQYAACPYSRFVGGAGPRSRRLVAFPSQALVYTAGQQSLYVTPEVTEIPVTLEATGQPDTVNPNTSTTFTDGNVVCTYEPEEIGLAEIDVNATYGLPGFRPCVLTLTAPANPPVISTVQGISGNLNFYLANGAVNAGTVITATVSAPHIPSGFRVTLRVVQDYFSPDENTYVNIGSVPVALNDLEFNRFGLVIAFHVDETGVSSVSLPPGSLPVAQGADAVVYSTFYGTSIAYDSAVYSNPVSQSEFTDGVFAESSVVAPVIGCFGSGPIGLYCYSDVTTGSLAIQFPQPYTDPAPFIAYATNPGYCYSNPVLVSNGTLSTLPLNLPNVTLFSDSFYCGTFYAYAPCDGSTANVAIAYPANTVPHSFIDYANHAWSLVGIQSNPGTLQQVSRNNVSPLLACNDPVFTGSNPAGSSLPYLDYETGGTVVVNFPDLSYGIPFVGAAAQIIDPGANNLTSGIASVYFTGRNRVATLINAVQGSGNLTFLLRGDIVNYAKSFCVKSSNGGETTYPIFSKQFKVTVAPGQKIILTISTALSPNSVLTGVVEWNPTVTLPRLFDSESISFSGSATVKAVGFTGLSSQEDYQFYGTLPADAALESVNPDSIVTVQGASDAEQVLIRCRGVGEPVPVLPPALAWYSGGFLNSPVTFRFYAARALQGAHGEMDVWMSSPGGFPSYFSVSPYKALTMPSWAYPKNPNQTDTSRNSLRVIPNQMILGTGFLYPRVYTSNAGYQIVIAANAYPDTISVSGTNYGLTSVAPGLAYDIDIVQFQDATRYLVTESGLQILTESGLPLETELQ